MSLNCTSLFPCQKCLDTTRLYLLTAPDVVRLTTLQRGYLKNYLWASKRFPSALVTLNFASGDGAVHLGLKIQCEFYT